MNFEERFKRNWIEHFPFIEPKGSMVVVAVSGGVDSVVLAHLMHRMQFLIVIAHANFQLRGDSSTADETLVKELATNLNADFFVQRFDTKKWVNEWKISTQEAARNLRYEWFTSLVRDVLPKKYGTHKAYWILTAHHAGDNRETVMMNIFRGAGIDGLKGMLPRNVHLIRPLLFAEKNELQQYAEQNNLRWNEDASNKETVYTRNFFRLEVMPKILEVFPQAESTLLQNIEHWRTASEFLKASASATKQKLLQKKNADYLLPILKLKSIAGFEYLLFEIASDFNFSSAQIPDLLQLLNSDPGKYVASTTHRFINNRKHIVITSIDEQQSDFIIIDQSIKHIKFPGGKLELKKLRADVCRIPTQPSKAILDMDEISFPLTLRKWKQGDYFYPFGMNKKKKLSRFFIDEKLSLPEKENAWVLLSGEKIVWVVGKRIDNRFKLTSKTKNVLKLKFVPA